MSLLALVRIYWIIYLNSLVFIGLFIDSYLKKWYIDIVPNALVIIVCLLEKPRVG
jgi:hypothetical protein